MADEINDTAPTPSLSLRAQIRDILTRIDRIENRLDKEFLPRAEVKEVNGLLVSTERGTKRRAYDEENILDVPGMGLFNNDTMFKRCILKHLMQLTVYLWSADSGHAGHSIDGGADTFLHHFFSTHSIDTAGVSGLSLLLFSMHSGTSATTTAVDSTVGKVYTALVALVVQSIFGEVKRTFYRHWDGDRGVFETGLGTYGDTLPPRYLGSELGDRYGRNELDFTFEVIRAFCRSPSMRYGYPGLLAGPPSATRDAAGRISPYTIPDGTPGQIDPVLSADVDDMRLRCILMKRVQRQVRNLLNIVRHESRRTFSSHLLFILPIIRSHKAAGRVPKDEGCFIEWKNLEGDINARWGLDDPAVWDIPRSRARAAPNGDQFNLQALEEMKTNFHGMHCILHYRCIVRDPTYDSEPDLYNQYIDDLADADTQYLFLPRTKWVSLHELALLIWKNVMNSNPEHWRETILGSSRYSLVATHIFAMALRAVIVGETEESASIAESTAASSIDIGGQVISHDTFSSIMVPAGNVRHRDGLTSMSYSDYIDELNKGTSAPNGDVQPNGNVADGSPDGHSRESASTVEDD